MIFDYIIISHNRAVARSPGYRPVQVYMSLNDYINLLSYLTLIVNVLLTDVLPVNVGAISLPTTSTFQIPL